MMMDSIENALWFPEPPAPDETYARRGEGHFKWLQRSTIARAVECRRFLNSNLAHLPPDHAATLHARLRHNWRAAFFELIVARTLQVLGAEVEVEPSMDDGRRPDFKAKFRSSSVIVEATSPVFLGALQKDMVSKDALLDIIELLAPESWGVLVNKLPDLGPADSKKEFKRVVAELLNLPDPTDDETRRVSAATSDGTIELTLIPRRGWQSSVVVGGPAFSFLGDGVEDIRTAVRRKRSQVRSTTEPVLLAVNAYELNSDLDCFDRALFGGECLHVDQHGRPIRTEFVADGMLTPHGERPPTFAGVLAYIEVGFRCSNEPVLYLHPRFKGVLPAELSALQWRTMDELRGISVMPAKAEGILPRLGPVRV